MDWKDDVLRHDQKAATKTRAGNRRGAKLAAIAVGATIALGGIGIRAGGRPSSRASSAAGSRAERRRLRQALRRRRRTSASRRRPTSAAPPPAGPSSTTASDDLRKEVEKARREAKPEYGTPESVGVDQSTLDAIAACESGGDPTAVDSSGTYRGKYQFDLGTWASVGGSGDPAAAPEAEQDYRAALLMSRAGSSPWPVCG